jgi:hypothetical protein
MKSINLKKANYEVLILHVINIRNVKFVNVKIP